MARLPDVTDDELADELRPLADAQRKRYGAVLNTLRQSAYAPNVAQGATEMGKALGRSRRITTRLDYLLNLRVAAIVGCPF